MHAQPRIGGRGYIRWRRHIPVWRRPNLAFLILSLAHQWAGGARYGDPAADKVGRDQLDTEPIADQPRLDFDRRHARQPKHVDRKPRRDELVSPMTLLDGESQEADNDTAVQ